MELSDADVERIADAVAARMEARSTGRGLVTLRAFAKSRGVDRSTVYRWAKRWGFPIRDGAGEPKEEGDTSAAYVYVPEVERKEEMHQRSIQNGIHA